MRSDAQQAARPVVPELAADDLLAALTKHPGAAVTGLVAKLPEISIEPADATVAKELVTVELAGRRQLVWRAGRDADAAERDVARLDLARLAGQLDQLAQLDARTSQLQRLALCDDLTGCANKRYFRHFLDRILASARRNRFPVTLLLFDIDDFKHYNDRHGHATGDQILKQTGALIKRSVRDHDFVARIGGDEFAVVFWEKDEPGSTDKPPVVDGDASEEHRQAGRFPKGPLQIAARFRRMISEPEFAALGPSGVGQLTISGGMAVFPYDASDAATLLAAADEALVFGAKRAGKNSIALVGDSRPVEV